MEKITKNNDTKDKLDKLKEELSNSEKCKEFSKKLLEYIKTNTKADD